MKMPTMMSPMAGERNTTVGSSVVPLPSAQSHPTTESVFDVIQHLSSQYKLASLMNEFPVVGDGQGRNLSGSSGAGWCGGWLLGALQTQSSHNKKITPLGFDLLLPGAGSWPSMARSIPLRNEGLVPKEGKGEPTEADRH